MQCIHHWSTFCSGRFDVFLDMDTLRESVINTLISNTVLQIEYDKEQKGPVSSLDHVQGFLITAIGQKVSHCHTSPIKPQLLDKRYVSTAVLLNRYFSTRL